MKPDKAPARAPRRVYPGELKKEAAPMLLGGHSAPSVARNLGIRHAPLLYRWKAGALGRQGQAASAPEARVRQLQEPLRRTERERDVLKKALAIFSRATGRRPTP